MDYYSNIEKCMVIGDFNCEPDQPLMKAFLQENHLYCHIKFKILKETASILFFR